jgi:hypothetical protein
MKMSRFRLFAIVLCLIVIALVVPSRFVRKVGAVCPTCAPTPPPPPTVGQFGGPLAGLTTSVTNLFNAGYGTFTIKWDPIRGLGPVSTQPGCFTCHGVGVNVLTGTAGDTGTVIGVRYGKWNPDNTFNYLDGNGTSPENEGGPIVHGISNAAFGTLPGCTTTNLPPEVVPADATVVSHIRAPQLFGLGLIDNIPDSAILANVGTTKAYGITGIANMVADENGVVRPGRFGQKLNVVSLFQFTANAEFNELGITNTYFPNEHLPQGLPYPTNCQPDANSPQDVNQVNLVKITQFNALLAPVAPQAPTTATAAGKVVFENIGCNICHQETFTTQANVKLKTSATAFTAVIPSLSNVAFNPYSDFLLHDMGTAESGGIPFQPDNTGQATLTMWRTAPLWGLSNMITKAGGLMHDSRSTTIDAAIRRHAGEAATVESSYVSLNSTDSANLLAFLGSL